MRSADGTARIHAARGRDADAPAAFAERIIAWQRLHGRRDLPWQHSHDAYRVWVSEIMLQQTQVATVLPYFERFIADFPDVRSLACAAEDEVLAHWSGLGYYRRARHLHAAARTVVQRHAGSMPVTVEGLAALPGIGRSTAAAIAALALGVRAAILDGNVKRVLARHRAIDGYPGNAAVEAELWGVAEALLPERDCGPYTQGLMDLGATVCTRSRPRCDVCPVAADCRALRMQRVDALPQPRPKRVLPTREVHVLLLEHAGRVLVERRPARGVWGGLWSLPEIAVTADAADTCAAHWRVPSHALQAWTPVAHAFTHYRLTMRPLHVRLPREPALPSADARWLAIRDAPAAALPAPIKALVRALTPMPLLASAS